MRRFVALVNGLPFDTSNLWAEERAKRAADAGGWTLADHLAAMNAELTHAVYVAVLASIPRTKPVKLPEPLRIPRPGNEPKQPRRVTPFEFIQSMRR